MKIALAQTNPVIGDVSGNKEKIISFIKKAESENADLIVFTELATVGYPPMDLLYNDKLIRDNLDAIEEIAKNSEIAVICGFIAQDEKDDHILYNAAAFINDQKIISIHNKTLLPIYDVFDEMRYFTPASEISPVVFKGRKIGITICEDLWYDEIDKSEDIIIGNKYRVDPVNELCKKKIDLLINLSASPYEKGKNTSKWNMISNIAEKNNVPIVYVNQVGGNDSLVFDGNSFYMNSKGEIIEMLEGFNEDMIIIDDRNKMTVMSPIENEIEDVRKALILGIRDYTRKCGFTNVVIGLSGGIDSALTAALAAQALGPDKVLGITMPSMYSSEGSINDSKKLADNLGIRFEEIPIKNIYDKFNEHLSGIFKGMPMDLTEENLQARIRGNILMSVSNKFGSLLLTTGNKSELAMGYCTLYGDMAGGLAVISDLPKTMVYQLSRYINTEREIIPVETIEKPPSAELRPDQKDEDSLPPYELLDQVLERYVERHYSAAEIINEGFDEEIVKSVLRTINRNEFKRRQAPPGLKVTTKAFGSGRRIPIAQRFIP